MINGLMERPMGRSWPAWHAMPGRVSHAMHLFGDRDAQTITATDTRPHPEPEASGDRQAARRLEELEDLVLMMQGSWTTSWPAWNDWKKSPGNRDPARLRWRARSQHHAVRYPASVVSRADRGPVSGRTQPSQPSQSDSCPTSEGELRRDTHRSTFLMGYLAVVVPVSVQQV